MLMMLFLDVCSEVSPASARGSTVVIGILAGVAASSARASPPPHHPLGLLLFLWLCKGWHPGARWQGKCPA